MGSSLSIYHMSLTVHEYNILIFFASVLLLIYGVHVLMKFNVILTSRAAIPSKKLVEIRGLGENLHYLESVSAQHAAGIIHHREAEPAQFIDINFIPYKVMDIRVDGNDYSIRIDLYTLISVNVYICLNMNIDLVLENLSNKNIMEQFSPLCELVNSPVFVDGREGDKNSMHYLHVLPVVQRHQMEKNDMKSALYDMKLTNISLIVVPTNPKDAQELINIEFNPNSSSSGAATTAGAADMNTIASGDVEMGEWSRNTVDALTPDANSSFENKHLLSSLKADKLNKNNNNNSTLLHSVFVLPYSIKNANTEEKEVETVVLSEDTQSNDDATPNAPSAKESNVSIKAYHCIGNHTNSTSALVHSGEKYYYSANEVYGYSPLFNHQTIVKANQNPDNSNAAITQASGDVINFNEEDSEAICVVCLTEIRNVVLLPCRYVGDIISCIYR